MSTPPKKPKIPAKRQLTGSDDGTIEIGSSHSDSESETELVLDSKNFKSPPQR